MRPANGPHSETQQDGEPDADEIGGEKPSQAVQGGVGQDRRFLPDIDFMGLAEGPVIPLN